MSEEKIPPRYLRLKDNHPTTQKLQQVFDLMSELGLTISVGRMVTHITDRENEKYDCLELLDVENEEQLIADFPPCFEYKIRTNNPEYLQYEEKKYEQERLAREEQEKKLKAEREAAERRRKLEEAERKRAYALRQVEEAEKVLRELEQGEEK